MNDLSNYSLIVDDYNTLITISGDILSIDDNGNCDVVTDDIVLSTVIHPKVLEAYDKQDFFLEMGDQVELLGTYAKIEDELKILIIRCIAYPKAPKYVS